MIKRRHFLELTAYSTLVTLGLSSRDLLHKSIRYGQVIAQNTPRKLALLVGVNDYNNPTFPNLKGCVTDVYLQEALLTHHFGFKSEDIMRLTTDSREQKPTRNNILTAFEEHLIKQAQPGDVVVFHFSGHGSLQLDPHPIADCSNAQTQARRNPANTTFVVADRGSAPDIMGRTLFLLMSALKTENVTAVLDCCYAGGGTRGIHRVRSASEDGQLVPAQLNYQQKWMKQLQWSPEEFSQRRCQGVANGVVIASARADEEAMDADFGDFQAGAFTYFLTQYLWQEHSTVDRTITQVRHLITRKSRQKPLADGTQKQPFYFINRQTPPTDAVVTQVQNNRVKLWLGGLDENSLAAFSSGAVFSILDKDNQPRGDEIYLENRQGLLAEGTWKKQGSESLEAGALLREKSRTVPTEFNLRIGLDTSIASETSIAKQEISKINRLKAIPEQNSEIPYPGGVEYILSRVTAETREQLQQQGVKDLPVVGSIGLFSAELNPIAQSFGTPGESVEAAINNRLKAKLKALLAVHLIKTTLNARSSQLAVEASVSLVEQPEQIIARTQTQKVTHSDNFPGAVAQFKLNQSFQFQVRNYGLDTLYVLMMVVDSQGWLYIIFPGAATISDEKIQLLANEIKQSESLKGIETGTGEALIVVSRYPLTQAINTLRSLVGELNQNQGTIALQERGQGGLDFINQLFDDLQERNLNSSSQQLSTTDMATLSISFEII